MFDYYLTADDVLSGSVDNMSDEEIDRDVKLFRRIAQKLGIRNYNDLIVVPGEDDYNPDYYAQPLGIFSSNLYKNNDSIKVWSVDGIDFVSEELNGTLYLYFKDETTASKYKDMVDIFNNDYAEGVNESMDESLKEDFTSDEYVSPRWADYYKKVARGVDSELEDKIAGTHWHMGDGRDEDGKVRVTVDFRNGDSHTFEFETWRFSNTMPYLSYDVDIVVQEIIRYMKSNGLMDLDEIDYWEEIASKEVADSDGFYTDYTLYYNESEGRFVCIFGDKSIYDPTNTEPDFECEEQWEAFEWFEDYDTGEPDGEDDTIYESHSNKSLNESGYENVIADLESIEKFLTSNGFYNYEVYNYDNFPMGTSKIDFEVKGDWKHDHLFFKTLINEWAEQNNRKIFKIDSREVGESDSDYYTAIYSVYITKDDDSFNTLNSMRGLFAESLDTSNNMNLNESLSQYYKIGGKGNELIYTISSLRYSGESESSDPYAVVYMTLVCGWDYCSDWSDKMGWVDPENWVEDVQTDYFIVYLSDETIEQALADNGYTPTSKPSPIYHYNEEKDSWEVLKESLSVDKYIRESLNELDNKAINEDTKFHDLRSLYEAFSNKLTSQQKQELKKVIDSTDDAEIIAAAIQTKAKNEDLDFGSDDIFGDEPDNNYSVSAFLTRKGYQNYLGLSDDLWTDDLSEAEDFIWDCLRKGFYVEFNDYTTIKTDGYATTKYFNPDDLDETTVDYRELEESKRVVEALPTSKDKIRIAENSTDPKELERLAYDDDWRVRWNVALNENAPVTVFEILKNDKNEWVRKAVAMSSKIPLEILEFLANDEDEGVRLEVVKNPTISPEILEFLANDANKEVRYYVALDSNTPPEVLEILANDEDEIIRGCVVTNPSTPPEVLEILADDDDPYVRKYAANHPNNSKSKSKKVKESLEENVFNPIEKQMRTERGLIYVKGSYPSREAAREAGYDYAFHSRDLGKDLFSKTTKDINHREFVIIEEPLT